MGHNNRNDSIRKKIKSPARKSFRPEVYVDQDSDFASIKIAPGIESKSYVKDGIVFCEDSKGKIIEIQVLNLSELALRKTTAA